MIGQALGRVITPNGNFLFTSKHRKLYVGVWEHGERKPSLLKIRGKYAIETFFVPVPVEVQPHAVDLDKINQALEEAELVNQKESEPEDLMEY